MRHARYFTFVTFAALLPCVTASAQRLNLPPIVRTTWPNGAHIVLMEYHKAPTLSVEVLFPGGSSTDPAGKSGLASLTATLMRRGTTTKTAEQLAEEIDFWGGSLDAAAGMDRFTARLNVLEKDADAGLNLLADTILHPTFPADELERARTLAISELKALPEDPGAVADRIETETVFAGHPYGTRPTLNSLARISREDVLACFSRTVSPKQMIVVAVGDFKVDEMNSLLKAKFGKWTGSSAINPAVPLVKPVAPRFVLINKPDATQTQVRIMRTAYPRSSPDYLPGLVANTILGGGFTSRLTDEIRVNRKLTYGISSSFDALRYGGEFSISSFTKVESTRAMLDAVYALMDKTAEKGFTQAELTKVKGYLAGLYAISMQTPESIAGQLADIAFNKLPNNYMAMYLPNLKAVKLEDVNRIAKTYCRRRYFSTVLVAPQARVVKQLSGLGKFEMRSVEAIATGGGTTVDNATKQRIDQWIKDKGLNQYGDKPGTMYMGGTPLFDERNGKTKDRYEYILEKHPELRNAGK